MRKIGQHIPIKIIAFLKYDFQKFISSSSFQGLGYPTIELKNPGDWKCKLGLKDDLSDLDIKKLNTLYMVNSFVQLFL